MPYPGDNCSIASVLTAAAPGAVAVIRVQAAESAATRAFEEFRRADRRSPLDAEQGRLLYGSWNSEDLIVVRTADATWEIHCHGGPVAQQRILQDLAAAGIQIDPVNRETPLADDAHSDDAQIVTTAIQQALQNSRTRAAAKGSPVSRPLRSSTGTGARAEVEFLRGAPDICISDHIDRTSQCRQVITAECADGAQPRHRLRNTRYNPRYCGGRNRR